MNKKNYKIYEEMFRKHKPSGIMLEIGAMTNELTLLVSKELNGNEKVGIHLEEAVEYKGIKILQMNSNDMKNFADGSFDVVLSHNVLEHDKYFWKSLSEMKRVLKKGGMMFIGVPTLHNHILNRFIYATTTFMIHECPDDYYRFTEQAVKDVIFDGFDILEMKTVSIPPRTIACGVKRG